MVPRQRGLEEKPEERWNDRRTTSTQSVWRHRIRKAATQTKHKEKKRKKQSAGITIKLTEVVAQFPPQT